MGWIEEIPETLNTDAVEDICPPTLLETVRVRGVNAKGDWIKPSRTTTLFSSFLSISNLWALPAPSDANVTAVPALAFDAEVANLKVSFVKRIANTSVGRFVLWAVVIAVAATPTKVLSGVYFNFSPVLKKWSVIVNTPVAAFNVVVLVGANVFAKMGTPSCFKSNAVLFDLLPLIALYCATSTDSLTVPYCKLGGTLKRSISL